VPDSTAVTFVGIDAHLSTLSLAVLPSHGPAVDQPRTIANEPAVVRRVFRRLLHLGPVHAVYEAGCLGFSLRRRLEELGVHCDVAAPSLVPARPGEHRKTDRLDAQRLAHFLRSGDLVLVSPPTAESEALRSLTRARCATKQDTKRVKQRINSFLLARGLAWPGKTKWTRDHRLWLRNLEFDLDDDRFVRDFLLRELKQREDSVAELDLRIEERAKHQDCCSQVADLRAFRGVDTLTALSVLAEIGDPRRFRSGYLVGAFCGLVPSEHSSGPRVHRGEITRSGNRHLRRLLIEAATKYSLRIDEGVKLERRRMAASPAARTLARRAERRLASKYWRIARTRPANVARTAVARELAAFLWAALTPELQA